MKKVTAPAGPVVHGPDNATQPDTPWWVDGVLYTDDRARLARFAELGFAIEDAVDGAPEPYLDEVARMQRASRTAGVRPAVAIQDAADPDRRNY